MTSHHTDLRLGASATRGATIGVTGPMDLGLLKGSLQRTAPASSGYAAPVISELVLELLRRGRRVVAFTASPDARDVGTYTGTNFTLVVIPYRPRARWMDAFRAERRALGAAMAAHPCDVIHAHWTYEFALAAIRSGSPHLVTVHDWGPQVLRYQKHPYRAVRLAMQIKVLARADHLTANSPYIARKVRRWFDRDVRVIPNGIVVPSSPPERVTNDVITVGALNNGFGPRKNVTALLHAFGQVRASDGDARLCLAGTDYEEGGPAHTWTLKQGLADRVEFLGPISAAEVPAFMRSLDLFVHPSLEESFGLVLIEAVVEGTPVIAGAESGAVPWVLGFGKAGSLVDVSDAQAIANEIVRLATSPTQRQELTERAVAHTRAEFSIGHVVDLYEAEYERILASS